MSYVQDKVFMAQRALKTGYRDSETEQNERENNYTFFEDEDAGVWGLLRGRLFLPAMLEG